MGVINDTLSYNECEAAMCLWEECLNRLDFARKSGGMSAMEECELWNLLRMGEGAANARDTCMELAPDLERCWIIAHEHFGFDDSFDWEFVPRWADLLLEQIDFIGYIDTKWLKYMAYKVTEDWKKSWN